MRVTVVGLGYVGLVSAAGFAEWGHDVVGVEADPRRVASLRAGQMPLFEPGLAELVAQHVESGRLVISEAAPAALSSAQVVVVCVGTHDGSGGWQTRTISDCLTAAVPHLAEDSVLVIRSTLPPAFLPVLRQRVVELRAEASLPPVSVLLNPEFTREGTALNDFLHPDRIVVGVVDDPDERGLAAVGRLYHQADAPVVVLPGPDALLAKLGSNLFLATKISFANELASLCDAFGGNVDHVVSAMALDPRIGGSFLRPGVGFGGSCLPHQVHMTIAAAREMGVATPLLAAVDGVNRGQRERFVAVLARMLDAPLDGARIALLGLTFKPGTDDLRDAPSLAIARILQSAGACVVAYDPMPAARALAPALVPGLEIAETAIEALENADAAGIVTEWPEFVELDWAAVRAVMRRAIVLDGRNALNPETVLGAGLRYASFGRPVGELAPIDAPSGPLPMDRVAVQVPVRELTGLRLD